MNWELLVCAQRGHATYAETDPGDPPPGGWRCLRCDALVEGPPRFRGPPPPHVRRDAELRDALVLRALAVERWVRAVVLLLAAYAVLRFQTEETALRQLLGRAVPAARPLAETLDIDLARSRVLDRLQGLLDTDPGRLRLIAMALAAYGALELLEGVGLWLLTRWGEYVAAVATAIFLPLEIYELFERVTVLRLLALAVNVGLLGYLVWRKRLFGLRRRTVSPGPTQPYPPGS